MVIAQTTAAERLARGRRAVRAPIVTVVAAFAVAVMAFAALADIVRRPDAALVKSDFAAFYCGAVVALAHGDPYALSALRTCEASRVDLPGGADPAAVGVDADPLPGYNMAFFAPFTLLPYREAALLWDALLIAAIAGTAAILATLSGLPFIVVAAILAFADGVSSITYGQIPPVLTLALALAAYGLERERRALVFLGAALSMLEPHIGLPACCAIFIWRPALRPGLLGVAAALVVLSVAALGLPLNFEYVRVELPSHAQAEATTSIQYSLAWLLHYFGVADAAAIRLASAQYGAFAVAGIALADPVARKCRTAAAIALFPPAVVLIGGSFVHIQQMTAAIPFALLVATRLRGASAAAIWSAIALLAVPWPAETRLMTLGAAAIVITVVMAGLAGRPPAAVAAAAVVAAVLYVGIAGPVMLRLVPAVPRHMLANAPPMPRAFDGERLASEEGAREERDVEGFAVATPRTLAAKLPTWLALCALVGVSLAAKSVRRPGAPART